MIVLRRLAKYCSKLSRLKIYFQIKLLTMIPNLSSNNPYLTLKHLEEVEPHGEQDVVGHESEGDGRMREDVVEVGDERPVAVVAHHML